MVPSEPSPENSSHTDHSPGCSIPAEPLDCHPVDSSQLELTAGAFAKQPASDPTRVASDVGRLPLVVPATNRPASGQIENLLHLRSQAEQGNLSSACLSPTTLTGSGSPHPEMQYLRHDSDSIAPALANHGSEMRQANSITATGDIWKSLGWLASMILVFLLAITVGPRVVEQYQYAAARGKMRAQYEAATDMLSKVSMRESALASELVVHRIRPSVVSIQAGSKQRNRSRQPMMRGQGSGIIVSDDGMVVTNNHVIEKAEEILVTLADRREFRATVVGRDVETDLAVLKIEATDLIPAEWGDSDELELGAPVWAMGSPFGLDQTVTRGIVSGKHRRTADNSGDANPHQDLLQTDAAVNPGNSGGPLVNSVGQVIGINTSIYGEFFQGISFAVPSSLAEEIVAKLIKSGQVQRGFLGVSPHDVTHADAVRLKLPEISGARLETVERDAPAFRAGLRPDDVVIKIGGKAIDNHIMLFRQIALTSPGDETAIDFYRDGKLSTTQVKVGYRPLYR